jgi:micrococcal nuclease
MKKIANNSLLASVIIAMATLLLMTSCDGRVTSVKDGDTIVVDRFTTIRIAEIDAPEKAQPYGMIAKEHLTEMVLGKEVRYVDLGYDRYGRHICKVYVGKKNIGDQMVKDGYAWAYTKYKTSDSIEMYQETAKANRLGMWQSSFNIYPSVWRYEHKR